MRQKIGVIITTVLIAVLMAPIAFAGVSCNAQDKPDLRHKGRMADITKELNLTADQEKQLKDSKESFRSQAENLRLKLKEKRQALQNELSRPGVTRQAVDPNVAEIKSLQSEMVDQRLDGIFKIKEILTPEQFSKLQAKKEARGKFGDMKHGWKER